MLLIMCSLTDRKTGPSRIYSSLVRSLFVPTDSQCLSAPSSVLLSVKTGSRDLGISCVFAYCIQCVNFWQGGRQVLGQSEHVLHNTGWIPSCTGIKASVPWIMLSLQFLYCKMMIVVEFEVTCLFGDCLCCLLVGIAIVCLLMNYAVRS